LLCGCKSPAADQRRSGLFQLPGEKITLLEMEGGGIAAFDTATGVRRWVYRPPLPHDKVVQPRGARLICAPLVTADGQIVLRYDSDVRAISLERGSFSWVRRCPRDCSALCVATTPDNGTLLLVEQNRRLIKLGPAGQSAWSIALPEQAVAAPQVASDSGNIVIRTLTKVIGLTARGETNWMRPVDGLVRN
jgi:outer membrane protein assembly factor BamB